MNNIHSRHTIKRLPSLA